MRKAAAMLAPVLFLTLSLVFFEQRPAHAYLDAGTTGMVVQFLLGGAFAGLFALTVFWRRVKSAFTRYVLRRPVVEVGAESEVDG